MSYYNATDGHTTLYMCRDKADTVELSIETASMTVKLGFTNENAVGMAKELLTLSKYTDGFWKRLDAAEKQCAETEELRGKIKFYRELDKKSFDEIQRLKGESKTYKDAYDAQALDLASWKRGVDTEAQGRAEVQKRLDEALEEGKALTDLVLKERDAHYNSLQQIQSINQKLSEDNARQSNLIIELGCGEAIDALVAQRLRDIAEELAP